MPSRKSHEKNRHGCEQCKARRVKCDLQVPVCGHCKRRSEPCSRGQGLFRHRRLATTTSPAPASPPVTNAPATNPLPLLELELMHHFSTVVYQTLSDDVVVQELWRREVPKEALHHTHLMHAVLAVAAVHLQLHSDNEVQKTKYQEPADQYYKSALSKLQPLVVKIDNDSCGSVLATALLLGVYSSSQSRFEHDHWKLLEDVWHNHQLLRGIFTMVEQVGPRVNAVKLYALVQTEPWDDTPLPAGFQHALDSLRAAIRSLVAPEDMRSEIYLGAVGRLEQNVRADVTNPDHVAVSYMLLMAADPRYLVLLGKFDPLAVAVAAHYALVLHRERRRWWMGEVGVRFFAALKAYMEEGSWGLIEWPERFLEERGAGEESDPLVYYS